MSENSAPPKVYVAMNAIAARLARIGIQKNQQNDHYHYNFRGIDQVFNTLGPLLAEFGLLITPRVVGTEVRDFVSNGGSTMFNVQLDVEYDFVAVEDGSRHTIRVRGEGMDAGDKACNKAMSAAYKLAAIQGFCIPIEPGSVDDADNDAPLRREAGRGAHTPEYMRQVRQNLEAAAATNLGAQLRQPEKAAPAPEGFGPWYTALVAAADRGRKVLSDAWRDGEDAFRDYIDAAYAGERERLKMIADAADGKPVI